MYHALLPDKNVRSLKREYSLRFFVVLAFFVSIGVVAGAVCLFPSYIFSTLGERAAVAQKASEDRMAAASTTEAIARALSDAGALASIVSTSTDAAPVSEAAERIAGLRSPGISLVSMDIRRTGPSRAEVVIEGVAATRDGLVAFQKALEADASFSQVTVPISNLAKSSGIHFSIQLSADLP